MEFLATFENTNNDKEMVVRLSGRRQQNNPTAITADDYKMLWVKFQ
jgi:hypothetical protein